MYVVEYNKLPKNVKRNNLIAVSAISIAIITTFIVSTGFGRSRVLMDIEAYEREEAAQQNTSATPTTVTQSESPSIDTPATSPSQKSTSREITALDRATSEAQDCFASAGDQRMCIPYLERMEEAARTGR